MRELETCAPLLVRMAIKTLSETTSPHVYVVQPQDSGEVSSEGAADGISARLDPSLKLWWCANFAKITHK